jgi:hypothetical protein
MAAFPRGEWERDYPEFRAAERHGDVPTRSVGTRVVQPTSPKSSALP